MNKHGELIVFWDNYETPVGFVTKANRGRIKFRYSPEWLAKGYQFISLSLPCSPESFEPRVSTNFFENFLPEGQTYLRLCKKHGLHEDDIFSFLEVFGHECAGALSIVAPWNNSASESKYLDITDNLEELLERHQAAEVCLMEETKARLSLAGFQNKLPVYVRDGRYFLPEEGRKPPPTTAILKSVSKNYPGLHKNEHFCMSLARDIGLKVPATELIQIGKSQAFLVQRYDRSLQGERIIRLHQEDFCQALGYSHLNKYQGGGGPGFAMCNDLLSNPVFKNFSSIRARFIKGVIFNYLIGNCDAHAKNFSILYSPEGEAGLAPFYDLVSTVIYKNLTNHFSMYIGRTANFYKTHELSWKIFCSDMRINVEMFSELATDVILAVKTKKDELLSRHSEAYGDHEDYGLIQRDLNLNIESLEKIIGSSLFRAGK